MVKIIHVFFLISETYTSRKTDCMLTFAYQHPAPYIYLNIVMSYQEHSHLIQSFFLAILGGPHFVRI